MKQFTENLPLNLQFFADENSDNQDDNDNSNSDNVNKQNSDNADDKGSDDNQNDNQDDNKGTDDVEFTDEQQQKVNQIIQDRVKAEQQKAEDQRKEAEKLAKMNAQQKQEYELEKANKKTEELEAELNRFQMSKEASKMLSDRSINVTDDLLDVVTKETADDTKAMVETFLNVVDSEVQKQIADKLKGSTPKTGTETTSQKENWEEFLN